MPEAANCADEPLGVPVIAQSLAHHPQPCCDGGIRNEAPVPNDGNHFLFADNTLGVRHQQAQKSVGLGFKCDDTRRGPKLGAICIQHKRFELQAHVEDYQIRKNNSTIPQEVLKQRLSRENISVACQASGQGKQHQQEQVMMALSTSLQDSLPTKRGQLVVQTARTWITRWLGLLHSSVERVDTAHALRCKLASLPQDTLRDTGLTPEDASSISAWQPDLPFFMQNSFGRY